MRKNIPYVAHICRNKKCDSGWIGLDLTDARNKPPSWKYCRECAEKLGIDYDSQTPESNLTPKELKEKKRLAERLKGIRHKNKKINSQEGKRG